MHHWRLGFKQSGLHHIARASRAPAVRIFRPLSLPHHALVPFGFRRQVGWATQKSLSSELLPVVRGIDDWVKRRTRPGHRSPPAPLSHPLRQETRPGRLCPFPALAGLRGARAGEGTCGGLALRGNAGHRVRGRAGGAISGAPSAGQGTPAGGGRAAAVRDTVPLGAAAAMGLERRGVAEGASTPALCAAQAAAGVADAGRASWLTAFLPRLPQTSAGYVLIWCIPGVENVTLAPSW